jgi:formylglycine-generating enzyme required for sulfatase activity
MFILCLAGLAAGCLVKRKCFRDDDCPEPKICNHRGRCAYECTRPWHCDEGWVCVNHRCVPEEVEIECPEDMVAIESFCMDIYEASRPDATATSQGTDDSRATSRPGVLPWTGDDDRGILVHVEDAQRACEAAGKRLCTPEEWQYSCSGTAGSTYSYGDLYSSTACNGLDLYGSIEEAWLVPTGSFPDCVNEWGVYDLTGNAYEHVEGDSDANARGGSYESTRPREETHRCDHVPTTWVPCYCSLGFRCCLTPGEDAEEPVEPVDEADASSEDVFEVVQDLDVIEEDPIEESDVPPRCPEGMVDAGTFCIDRYEASRDNATATHSGTSSTPTSRPGVLPWVHATLLEAREACSSVGKYLCTLDEWSEACTGPTDTVYTYGDDYEPERCNGTDTFCDCSSSACSGLTTCPYPGCYTEESPEGGGPCGGSPHLMPTGSFRRCTNGYGLLDASGNAWELVDLGDDTLQVMGGGYNSIEPVTQLACGFHPEHWLPCTCSRGFRCCKETYY